MEPSVDASRTEEGTWPSPGWGLRVESTPELPIYMLEGPGLVQGLKILQTKGLARGESSKAATLDVCSTPGTFLLKAPTEGPA